MKMIFCTLAICLSVLAATLSLSNLVRSEGKKTRSAIAKSSAEPSAPDARKELAAQKLDLINTQLAAIDRQLAALADITKRTTGATDDASHAEIRTLTRSVEGLNTSLARLQGVPAHLADLTTYLDRSFEHLEKNMTTTATPNDLPTTIGKMNEKLDAIDGYFTPLYLFLGLPYSPDANDLVAAYPSVDERVNEISGQITSLQQEVSKIHRMLSSWIIEPKQP